jgi:hypothetical protein
VADGAAAFRRGIANNFIMRETGQFSSMRIRGEYKRMHGMRTGGCMKVRENVKCAGGCHTTTGRSLEGIGGT